MPRDLSHDFLTATFLKVWPDGHQRPGSHFKCRSQAPSPVESSLKAAHCPQGNRVAPHFLGSQQGCRLGCRCPDLPRSTAEQGSRAGPGVRVLLSCSLTGSEGCEHLPRCIWCPPARTGNSQRSFQGREAEGLSPGWRLVCDSWAAVTSFGLSFLQSLTSRLILFGSWGPHVEAPAVGAAEKASKRAGCRNPSLTPIFEKEGLPTPTPCRLSLWACTEFTSYRRP